MNGVSQTTGGINETFHKTRATDMGCRNAEGEDAELHAGNCRPGPRQAMGCGGENICTKIEIDIHYQIRDGENGMVRGKEVFCVQQDVGIKKFARKMSRKFIIRVRGH